jgi:hypothetical protein
VLGGLVLFVAVAFLTLTIRFRNLAEIQNSQEYLLYCIILGGLLAGGRVINAALPLSDSTCVAGFWLGNLSFWMAVMAFLLKSWRVSRLLAIRSIKRVRITTGQIMGYMFLSVLFLVGLLVLLTVVGQPHYHEKVTESSNQETLVPYCSMTHPEVQTVLYVIYALLLGAGLRFCWSLREVPKKFSDFHTIGSGETSPSLLPLLSRLLSLCSSSHSTRCHCRLQRVRDASSLSLRPPTRHLKRHCQRSLRSHCSPRLDDRLR